MEGSSYLTEGTLLLTVHLAPRGQHRTGHYCVTVSQPSALYRLSCHLLSVMVLSSLNGRREPGERAPRRHYLHSPGRGYSELLLVAVKGLNRRLWSRGVVTKSTAAVLHGCVVLQESAFHTMLPKALGA